MEVFESLVTQGANIHQENNKEMTPLHTAARHGHPTIVSRLIISGADLNHHDHFNNTPSHYAFVYGHSFVHELISEFSKIPQLPPHSLTSLIMDLKERHLDVSRLVRLFVDFTSLEFYGFDESSQAFAHLVESVSKHEERDILLLEKLWEQFMGEFHGRMPDLIGSRIGEQYVLEFMLQNRICLTIVEEWADLATNMRNIVLLLKGDYSESHLMGLQPHFHSTRSVLKNGPRIQNHSSKLLNRILGRSKSQGDDEQVDMENGDRSSIEFSKISSNDEDSHAMNGKEGEDEGEEEKKSLEDQKVTFALKSEYHEDKTLNEVSEDLEVEVKSGIDSSLYFMLQLRLGVGSDYNASWKESEDQDGFDEKDWPYVFKNILINSPRSHGLLSEFLKVNGFQNWNGMEKDILYPNLLFLSEDMTSWSGLSNSLPLKPSRFNTFSPQFCYAWRLNPNIGTNIIMDRRVTQAIASSPVIEKLMDTPVIHHLFEHKWFNYGMNVTRILLFMYSVFLICATNVILWVASGEIHTVAFRWNVGIATFLISIQVLVESFQIYNISQQESVLSAKIWIVITDYLLDKWNALDLSIIIFWFVGLRRINSDYSQFSVEIFCSCAALLFWSKILYFGRGIKAYAILMEVLSTIFNDMFYFCVLLFMFLGAFAVAFRCLKVDTSTWWSFLRVFNMMFGDFDITELAGVSEGSTFSIFLFVIFMVFVSLVMLNALIAIMGDSFDKAQEKSRIGYLASRAELLAEYEQMNFDRTSKFFQAKAVVVHHMLEERIPKQLRLINFILLTKDKISARTWNTAYVPILSFFFYLICGIPILIEILILFKVVCGWIGVEEESGDLMVFFPEQYGIPEPTATEGEEWYGRLPRVMNRIEQLEDKMVAFLEELKGGISLNLPERGNNLSKKGIQDGIDGRLDELENKLDHFANQVSKYQGITIETKGGDEDLTRLEKKLQDVIRDSISQSMEHLQETIVNEISGQIASSISDL